MWPEQFTLLLKKLDLNFITGVPCSFLTPFLSYISAVDIIKHIIATNEGEAVGLATGYHLATDKIPIVYMQNSGLGNAVNALTSLCAKQVYSIPLMIFLTWRGKPGVKDEPQHALMGHIMIQLLDTLQIPHEFAADNLEETERKLSLLKAEAFTRKRPTALIFPCPLFNTISQKKKPDAKLPMSREEALEIILSLTKTNPVISTTGKTSREIFELREKNHMSHKYDFLTVGSMGHAASIGLGVALNTRGTVFVIDGDGSVLMKMGVLATIGHYKLHNLVHIIIDNGSYESTGGQASVSDSLSWKQILYGAGYKSTVEIIKKEDLLKLNSSSLKKPCGVIIKVHQGSRKDLGRPTSAPIQNKEEFMRFLRSKGN